MGYGASRMVVEGLFAARGVVLASILGPELFGVWALFRMGLRYCGFAGLGILRGLEVEAARAEVAHQRPYTWRQAYWGRIVAGHTLALYGLISVVAGLAWLWWDEGVASLALLGIALGVLLDRLWMFGLTFLRLAGALSRYAVAELVQAVLQLVLSAVLALAWGVVGAFAGFALAHLAGLVLLSGRAPLLPSWSWKRVLHLVRIGFPVSLAGILSAGLMTVDRLLVGALEGVGALGTYAFAVTLSSLGVASALVVRTVILTEVYGNRSAEPVQGGSLLDHSLAAFASMVPPLAGVAALGLAPAIATMLPQYQAAIAVAQIFVFIGVIQGLVNIVVLGIVAASRQGQLPIWGIGAIALNSALCLLALYGGLGLAGVAVAALVTRAIYAGAVVMVLAAGQLSGGGYAMVAKLLGPSLWCAAVVLGIGYALPVHEPEMLPLALLVYAVAIVPLLPTIARAFAKVRAS